MSFWRKVSQSMFFLRAIVGALIGVSFFGSAVYGAAPTSLSQWLPLRGVWNLDSDECHMEGDTLVCRKIAILESRKLTLDISKYKIIHVTFADFEGVSQIDLTLRAICTSKGDMKEILCSKSLVPGEGDRTIKFDLVDELDCPGRVSTQALVILKGKSIRVRGLKVSFHTPSIINRLSIFLGTFLDPVQFLGKRPNIVESPKLFDVPFVLVLAGIWFSGCITLIIFGRLNKRLGVKSIFLWSITVWIAGDLTNKCKAIVSIPLVKEVKGGYAPSVDFWQSYASEMSDRLDAFNINRLGWIGDSVAMYYFRFALFPVRVEREYRHQDALIFEKSPNIKLKNESLIVEDRVFLEDAECVFDHDRFMIVKGRVP
jgi:hypothetical protein